MMKIIIVGAGILGATAAIHLAKAGVDVTVVDRRLRDRRPMQRPESFVLGCPSVETNRGMRSQKAGRRTIHH